MCQGKDTKLSSLMYKVCRSLYDGGGFDFKWLAFIKNTLDLCGLTYVWLQPEIVNQKWFSLQIKQRLGDISEQEWNSEMFGNTLCTNYRMFKSRRNVEQYLTRLSEADRITFCKFRAGNHRLPISNRRFDSMAEKICKLCVLNVQGDEFHCLFVCPFFNDERRLYLKKFYCSNPNTLKFQSLFSSKNKSELKNICKFLKYIMSKF